MITSYSDFRSKLKSYLDDVFKSQSPLFVTRTKGENVVVLSQSDYDSIMETFYLLQSPKNASRLLSAVEEYNQGLGKEQNLVEE
jgi:antitoxin YefM